MKKTKISQISVLIGLILGVLVMIAASVPAGVSRELAIRAETLWSCYSYNYDY